MGIIFGATTKKLLYVGVRNKYCCVCSIAKNRGVEVGSHTCFKNWSGSSCAMEPDIITEGFQRSEEMHQLRFTQLVGDGDSSVFYSVALNVTYGRRVKKVECANHAVKCYRSHLEALLKDNPQYQGRGGLTKVTVKRITAGARSAIRNHSQTGDVNALRHEIRNGPRHCLGDHSKCVPGGLVQILVTLHCELITSENSSSSTENSTDKETTPLDSLQCLGILRSVEAAGDCLVSNVSSTDPR